MGQQQTKGKLIIISAPSGTGKGTIVNHLIERFPQLEFSVSATSRAPRGEERDGVEYHFLSNEQFAQAVAEDRFVEWEEVYSGTCYGTLKSEFQRIWARDHVIVFDVDVKGGLRLKEIFDGDALSLFIMPPSIEELRRRLVGRGTDSIEVIEKRLAKAEFELAHRNSYDFIVVNDDLKTAIAEAEQIISNFLKQK